MTDPPLLAALPFTHQAGIASIPLEHCSVLEVGEARRGGDGYRGVLSQLDGATA